MRATVRIGLLLMLPILALLVLALAMWPASFTGVKSNRFGLTAQPLDVGYYRSLAASNSASDTRRIRAMQLALERDPRDDIAVAWQIDQYLSKKRAFAAASEINILLTSRSAHYDWLFPVWDRMESAGEPCASATKRVRTNEWRTQYLAWSMRRVRSAEVVESCAAVMTELAGTFQPRVASMDLRPTKAVGP